MTVDIDKICHVCLEQTPKGVTLKKCSRCCTQNPAKYCNRDCQVSDWAIHKIFCGVTPAVTNPSGDKDMVQALLLPHDSKTPKLVQVQAGIDVARGVNASQYLPGRLVFDIKAYESEGFPVQIFNSEGYEMYCGFTLYYCTNSHLELNKCLDTIMSARAKAYFGTSEAVVSRLGKDFWKTLTKNQKNWNGPLLLVKSDRYKKNGSATPTYENLDMRDVPYLVNFLYILSGRIAQAEGLRR